MKDKIRKVKSLLEIMKEKNYKIEKSLTLSKIVVKLERMEEQTILALNRTFNIKIVKDMSIIIS